MKFSSWILVGACLAVLAVGGTQLARSSDSDTAVAEFDEEKFEAPPGVERAPAVEGPPIYED